MAFNPNQLRDKDGKWTKIVHELLKTTENLGNSPGPLTKGEANTVKKAINEHKAKGRGTPHAVDASHAEHLDHLAKSLRADAVEANNKKLSKVAQQKRKQARAVEKAQKLAQGGDVLTKDTATKPTSQPKTKKFQAYKAEGLNAKRNVKQMADAKLTAIAKVAPSNADEKALHTKVLAELKLRGVSVPGTVVEPDKIQGLPKDPPALWSPHGEVQVKQTHPGSESEYSKNNFTVKIGKATAGHVQLYNGKWHATSNQQGYGKHDSKDEAVAAVVAAKNKQLDATIATKEAGDVSPSKLGTISIEPAKTPGNYESYMSDTHEVRDATTGQRIGWVGNGDGGWIAMSKGKSPLGEGGATKTFKTKEEAADYLTIKAVPKGHASPDVLKPAAIPESEAITEEEGKKLSLPIRSYLKQHLELNTTYYDRARIFYLKNHGHPVNEADSASIGTMLDEWATKLENTANAGAPWIAKWQDESTRKSIMKGLSAFNGDKPLRRGTHGTSVIQAYEKKGDVVHDGQLVGTVHSPLDHHSDNWGKWLGKPLGIKGEQYATEAHDTPQLAAEALVAKGLHSLGPSHAPAPPSAPSEPVEPVAPVIPKPPENPSKKVKALPDAPDTHGDFKEGDHAHFFDAEGTHVNGIVESLDDGGMLRIRGSNFLSNGEPTGDKGPPRAVHHTAARKLKGGTSGQKHNVAFDDVKGGGFTKGDLIEYRNKQGTIERGYVLSPPYGSAPHASMTVRPASKADTTGYSYTTYGDVRGVVTEQGPQMPAAKVSQVVSMSAGARKELLAAIGPITEKSSAGKKQLVAALGRQTGQKRYKAKISPAAHTYLLHPRGGGFAQAEKRGKLTANVTKIRDQLLAGPKGKKVRGAKIEPFVKRDLPTTMYKPRKIPANARELHEELQRAIDRGENPEALDPSKRSVDGEVGHVQHMLYDLALGRLRGGDSETQKVVSDSEYKQRLEGEPNKLEDFKPGKSVVGLDGTKYKVASVTTDGEVAVFGPGNNLKKFRPDQFERLHPGVVKTRSEIRKTAKATIKLSTYATKGAVPYEQIFPDLRVSKTGSASFRAPVALSDDDEARLSEVVGYSSKVGINQMRKWAKENPGKGFMDFLRSEVSPDYASQHSLATLHTKMNSAVERAYEKQFGRRIAKLRAQENTVPYGFKLPEWKDVKLQEQTFADVETHIKRAARGSYVPTLHAHSRVEDGVLYHRGGQVEEVAESADKQVAVKDVPAGTTLLNASMDVFEVLPGNKLKLKSKGPHSTMTVNLGATITPGGNPTFHLLAGNAPKTGRKRTSTPVTSGRVLHGEDKAVTEALKRAGAKATVNSKNIDPGYRGRGKIYAGSMLLLETEPGKPDPGAFTKARVLVLEQFQEDFGAAISNIETHKKDAASQAGHNKTYYETRVKVGEWAKEAEKKLTAAKNREQLLQAIDHPAAQGMGPDGGLTLQNFRQGAKATVESAFAKTLGGKRIEYVPHVQPHHGAPTSQRGRITVEGHTPEEAIKKLQELGIVGELESHVPFEVVMRSPRREGLVLPLHSAYIRKEAAIPNSTHMVTQGITGGHGKAKLEFIVGSILEGGGIHSIAERYRRGIQVQSASPSGDIRSGIDHIIFCAMNSGGTVGSHSSVKFGMRPEALARRDVVMAPRDFGGMPTRYDLYKNYLNQLQRQTDHPTTSLYQPAPPEARQAHLNKVNKSPGSSEYNIGGSIPIEDMAVIGVDNQEMADYINQTLDRLMQEGKILRRPDVVIGRPEFKKATTIEKGS